MRKVGLFWFMSMVPLLASACLLASAPGTAQGCSREGGGHKTGATTKAQGVSGSYIRIKRLKGENQSAILEVKQIGTSKIHVHLTALWWPVGQEESANNGEIEATVALRNHVAVYRNGEYRLTLRFRDSGVVVTESGLSPDFGMNVSAAGTYRRKG